MIVPELLRLPVAAVTKHVTPAPALGLTVAGDEGAAVLADWRDGFAELVVDPGQSDISVSAMIAFLVVDEASEAHQCLLHLLVAVEPVLLAGAKFATQQSASFLAAL